MKKLIVSETQKDAMEKQKAANIVITILSVVTLIGAQVLNSLTEAEEQEASNSNT